MPPYNKSSLYLNLGCCVQYRQGQGSLGQRPTCDAPSLPLVLFSAEVKNNSRSYKKACSRCHRAFSCSPQHVPGPHTSPALPASNTTMMWEVGLRPQPRPEPGVREVSDQEVSPVSRRQDGQGEAATLGPTWKETCLLLSPKGRSKTTP